MTTENPDVPRIGVAALEPVPELIEEARKILQRAESGELRGLAYISICADSVTGYGVIGPEVRGSYMRTAGLLLWLANRCTSRWEENSPEK